MWIMWWANSHINYAYRIHEKTRAKIVKQCDGKYENEALKRKQIEETKFESVEFFIVE